MNKFYPVNIPKVNQADIKSVSKVMKNGSISLDGLEKQDYLCLA